FSRAGFDARAARVSRRLADRERVFIPAIAVRPATRRRLSLRVALPIFEAQRRAGGIARLVGAAAADRAGRRLRATDTVISLAGVDARAARGSRRVADRELAVIPAIAVRHATRRRRYHRVDRVVLEAQRRDGGIARLGGAAAADRAGRRLRATDTVISLAGVDARAARVSRRVADRERVVIPAIAVRHAT